MTFAELVRLKRQEMGITQRQLAERVSASERQVYNVERGVSDPALSLALAIAGVLGIDLSEVTAGRAETRQLPG